MTMTTLPPLTDALSPLAPAEMHRGANPELIGAELRLVISQAIANHPRSLQKAIGPSEIGMPCMRRLAYKLAQIPEVAEQVAAWRPTVGTAVHSWLADTFTAHNGIIGFTRYLTEFGVDVGDINGKPVIGSMDLYDRVTATVIDWKVVGNTTLRAAKANGPTEVYRTQVQLYGRGVIRRGLPVDTVAVMYLPVSGELSRAVFCPMPYDESVAIAALQRASAIANALEAAGPAIIAGLPKAEFYCHRCPWFIPGWNGDALQGCPGIGLGAAVNVLSKQLEGIILQ